MSESLLILKKKWFKSYKFSFSILILDMKYRYPKSKYKNNFYLFND